MRKVLRGLVLAMLWSGAKRRIKHDSPYIILISGSVGKTSAKEAIALVLGNSIRPLLYTHGNMNTEFGVPLSILGFNDWPQGFLEWLPTIVRSLFPPHTPGQKTEKPYFVLEVAADKPGDIAYLTQRLGYCDVAVMTPVVPTHMVNYVDFSELLDEETDILQVVRPTGYAVLPSDAKPLLAFAKQVPTTLWYGLHGHKKQMGSQGLIKSRKTTGISLQIDFNSLVLGDSTNHEHSEQLIVQTTVIGEHQLYALLAAATVGLQEGVGKELIIQALEAYMVPQGRGRVIEGVHSITLVDDSYNGAPDGVKAGLAMLHDFAGDRRVVAVLGSMNELGSMAEQAHREVAQHAAETVDFLVVVGQYRDQMLEAAASAGMSRSHMLAFATPEQLIAQAEEVVRTNDVVYVKGSQNNVRLERFVKALMAHPEQAAQVLVRQGKQWIKK